MAMPATVAGAGGGNRPKTNGSPVVRMVRLDARRFRLHRVLAHHGRSQQEFNVPLAEMNMQATVAISMTMTVAIAPADGGGTLARGGRTTT
jgi:hypothetical protein